MSRRTAMITAYVYGIVGADNQLLTAVAEDENTEVWMEALTPEGEYILFQAEAYHMERWAKAHGLQYYEGTIDIDVDLELVE